MKFMIGISKVKGKESDLLLLSEGVSKDDIDLSMSKNGDFREINDVDVLDVFKEKERVIENICVELKVSEDVFIIDVEDILKISFKEKNREEMNLKMIVIDKELKDK